MNTSYRSDSSAISSGAVFVRIGVAISRIVSEGAPFLKRTHLFEETLKPRWTDELEHDRLDVSRVPHCVHDNARPKQEPHQCPTEHASTGFACRARESPVQCLSITPRPRYRIPHETRTTHALGSARRRPVSAPRPGGLLRVPPALARGAVQGTNRFASSLACEQGGQVGPPAPLKLP